MSGTSHGPTNNSNPYKKDWIGFLLQMLGQRDIQTLCESCGHETLDHWPCLREINTKIPRSSIFRFENH